MARKKKRVKKHSVLGVMEGIKREKAFFECLQALYENKEQINVTIDPKHGGTPDSLLDILLKKLHSGYDRLFLWIDEDTDLRQEGREKLFKSWSLTEPQKSSFLNCRVSEIQCQYNQKMRNPILIVSQPISVESFILRVLGKKLCHTDMSDDKELLEQQKKELKSSLEGVLGITQEDEYYKNNINKESLEKRRIEISELDLLIKMIEGA
ncbi:MAG: hypothetical protein ACOYK8_08555 [Alphaproteobacteria bacterium]